LIGVFFMEQEKIEEIKKKISVLKWDKMRNQINPGKLAQLSALESELRQLEESA